MVAMCSSLAEVRQHIDVIDQQMLGLLAERGAYVRQAAGFKRDVAEVPAPERVRQVLDNIRNKAEQLGADAAVAETTWQAMIAAFIQAEQQHYAALNPSAASKPPQH